MRWHYSQAEQLAVGERVVRVGVVADEEGGLRLVGRQVLQRHAAVRRLALHACRQTLDSAHESHAVRLSSAMRQFLARGILHAAQHVARGMQHAAFNHGQLSPEHKQGREMEQPLAGAMASLHGMPKSSAGTAGTAYKLLTRSAITPRRKGNVPTSGMVVKLSSWLHRMFGSPTR